MCLSQPKAPAPVVIPEAPTPPPAPQSSPQQQDVSVQTSRQNQLNRQRKAALANNTLVTGGQGVSQPANTAQKTLYGQ